jgi:hypothetical protein
MSVPPLLNAAGAVAHRHPARLSRRAPAAQQGIAPPARSAHASSSCLAVIDQLAGTDPAARETATRRLVAQARRYTSGAWIDGLLIAAKAVR